MRIDWGWSCEREGENLLCQVTRAVGAKSIVGGAWEIDAELIDSECLPSVGVEDYGYDSE